MKQSRRLLYLFILLLCPVMVGCDTSPSIEPDTANQPTGGASALTVMSFNIRNGRADDGDNRWDRRKELVYGVINEHGPDLVGVQEAFRFQLDELAQNLPRYSEIGEGRDGGTANEYSAILYRADRFDVQASGTFWLSDTPEVVSKHWGNSHHRVCTWARLADRRTGVVFYHYNTHFDHQSQNARFNSAKLIAERIAERNPAAPVIVTGDLNAGEDNPATLWLKGKAQGPDRPPIALVDSFRVIHPDAKQVGTGNGGYRGNRDGAKIDYVLITPGIQTLDAAIDQEKRDGRYPSDHYPVIARLRIPPAEE